MWFQNRRAKWRKKEKVGAASHPFSPFNPGFGILTARGIIPPPHNALSQHSQPSQHHSHHPLQSPVGLHQSQHHHPHHHHHHHQQHHQHPHPQHHHHHHHARHQPSQNTTSYSDLLLKTYEHTFMSRYGLHSAAHLGQAFPPVAAAAAAVSGFYGPPGLSTLGLTPPQGLTGVGGGVVRSFGPLSLTLPPPGSFQHLLASMTSSALKAREGLLEMTNGSLSSTTASSSSVVTTSPVQSVSPPDNSAISIKINSNNNNNNHINSNNNNHLNNHNSATPRSASVSSTSTPSPTRDFDSGKLRVGPGISLPLSPEPGPPQPEDKEPARELLDSGKGDVRTSSIASLRLKAREHQLRIGADNGCSTRVVF